VYDKPFDSEDRYMACGFDSGGQSVFFAKGDPDVVLKMFGTYLTFAQGAQKLDLPFWQSTRDRAESISKAGDVVMALAYGVGAAAEPPAQYTLLCLIQLENPLQANVPGSMRKLRGEGIRTVMLTGDRVETALKVAVAAGIATDERLYLTGRLMARMGAFDIREQASFVPIFARVLPSQKALIIRLLQQKNKIVAMVGDGANDTLAMKAADVGVAFGDDASPMAKRVAPILINDLAGLVTLVEGGRRIRAGLGELAVFRAALLIVMFLGLYGWVYSLLR
jgi:Ca2+-transporting ATPase